MSEGILKACRTPQERILDEKFAAHDAGDCGQDCPFCNRCPTCDSHEIISRVYDFGTDASGYRNAGIRNVCVDCSAEWND